VQNVVLIQYAIGKEVYFRGKITFLEYTDSLATFCQQISQHFLTSVTETSCKTDPKVIDITRPTGSILSFSSIQNMSKVEGFGFIQEDFVLVMKNDYNLH
jgi:hypothetical protein